MSLISIWDYRSEYNVQYRVPYKYIGFFFFPHFFLLCSHYSRIWTIYLKACWFVLLPDQVWSLNLAINLSVQLFDFAKSRICYSYLFLWFICWYFHFVCGLFYLFLCVVFFTKCLSDCDFTTVLRPLWFCSLVVVSGAASLLFKLHFSIPSVSYDLDLCVFSWNWGIWKHWHLCILPSMLETFRNHSN